MSMSGECVRNYRWRVCSLAYEKMMHARVLDRTGVLAWEDESSCH